MTKSPSTRKPKRAKRRPTKPRAFKTASLAAASTTLSELIALLKAHTPKAVRADSQVGNVASDLDVLAGRINKKWALQGAQQFRSSEIKSGWIVSFLASYIDQKKASTQ